VPVFGPGNISFFDVEQFDSTAVFMRTKASGNGYKGAGGEHTIPLGLFGFTAGLVHVHDCTFDNVSQNFFEVYDEFPLEIKIENVFGLNALASYGSWVYQDPAGNKTITGVVFDNTATPPTLKVTCVAHGFNTNDVVMQRGIVYDPGGGAPPFPLSSALGSFRVVRIDADHYWVYREFNDLSVTLDHPYLSGGVVCKSGHVDLGRLLTHQFPVGTGDATISGTAGLTIKDSTPFRQLSFTRFRIGSGPGVDGSGNLPGPFIEDRLEGSFIHKPFEETVSRFGPRNNLFLPNLFSSVEGGGSAVVEAAFSGTNWTAANDTSKGYTVRKYTFTAGTTPIGTIELHTPAWGATMPAGVYTFLWESKQNFTGSWWCRFWQQGQTYAGGVMRDFGPCDDFVQHAFSFYHPGGGLTMRMVLAVIGVPDVEPGGGGFVIPCNWMIVKGRAAAGVPYIPPVDDPVNPTRNIVSTVQAPVSYASAKPTTGQYPAPTLVYNTVPSLWDDLGWVNVSSSMAGGSPTFQPFGFVGRPAWVQQSPGQAYLFLNPTSGPYTGTPDAIWSGSTLFLNNNGVPGAGSVIKTNNVNGFLVVASSAATYYDSGVHNLRGSLGFDTIIEVYAPNVSTLYLEGARVRNWKMLPLNNFTSGGSIGTAAGTVDTFAGVLINQTTAGQNLTLPNPTVTMAGKTFIVDNVGTAAFTMGGLQIAGATLVTFFWDGIQWAPEGGFKPTVGTYTAGATTPDVRGATYMKVANASATTITNFANGRNGQELTLEFADANTTINRTNAKLAGGANFTSSANAILKLVFSTADNKWREVCRTTNNS
jgi:hypothetical protein